MIKRKQWASAVRRGRKYDKDTTGVVKNKEKFEEPSGRRETKIKIFKRTRKRKKRDTCSGDVNHRPSPLEEFNDSNIDLDCDNEKEEHANSYNPSSALPTIITPRPLTVPSRCCHHDDKDTRKYNYDEYSSPSPIHSSSSPDGRRKKKGKRIKNNNKRAGKRRRHLKKLTIKYVLSVCIQLLFLITPRCCI